MWRDGKEGEGWGGVRRDGKEGEGWGEEGGGGVGERDSCDPAPWICHGSLSKPDGGRDKVWERTTPLETHAECILDWLSHSCCASHFVL